MFSLWGKIIRNNNILNDKTVIIEDKDTRTHKIFKALEEICYEFDLENPIWLDSNIEDFKRHNKTRFNQDSFIETIPFDFLEIYIIEED